MTLTTCSLLPAPAQTPSSSTPARPVPARNSIFLDPAHGGDDTGAHLPDQVLEKDVTLSLSNRIRLQLNTFGIPVFASRDADLSSPTDAASPATAPAAPAATTPAILTPDQRAGIANHAHPLACLILHASVSGTGVHLVTANLPPAPPPEDPDHPAPLPWLSAQAPSLPVSDRLASTLATSLARAGLPLNRFRANIRPLDSLTCPAVLVEVAPLSRSQPVTDPAYQARVAQAIATALLFFRGEVAPSEPPSSAAPSPSAPSDRSPQP